MEPYLVPQNEEPARPYDVAKAIAVVVDGHPLGGQAGDEETEVLGYTDGLETAHALFLLVFIVMPVAGLAAGWLLRRSATRRKPMRTRLANDRLSKRR